ncbi:MAG: YaiO family outer membrane beta-barrel protein [Burkholderiales bacterium]|nr:YaiO family outer membrane beta-barrel protein [Burkholderiales bacterium]
MTTHLLPRPGSRARALATWLATLVALPASAQSAPAAAPLGIELATGRQQLSNGSPDWTETSARVIHGWGTRQLSELGLVQTERFGLRDEQLTGLLVRPLGPQLTATVDASFSPSHQVLAHYHLGGMLQYEFAPAWLAHGGLRSTHYDTATVTQGSVMLEHYVSSFSWLAAWRPVQTQGSSTSSLELRGSYYYAEKSSVGLSVASGQEAASINDSTVQLTDVRSTTAFGRHWLTPAWALNYEWGSTRQGDFYTRQGWRIGVQHLF